MFYLTGSWKSESLVRAFNTNFAVLGTVVLLSPAVDSTVEMLTPASSCQEAANAEEYRIRVKDPIDGTKMLKINLTSIEIL